MEPVKATHTAVTRAQSTMLERVRKSTGTPRLLAVAVPASMALQFSRW